MNVKRTLDDKGVAATWNRRRFLGATGTMLTLPVLFAGTRPVEFVAEFVDAYNDKDRQAVARWAANRVSQGGLERQSAADWAEWLSGQFEHTGKLSLLAMEQRGSIVRLVCALEKVPMARRVDLRFDRYDPTRVFDLRPVAEPTPYIVGRGNLPGTTDVRGQIRQRLDFATSRGEFSGVVRIDRADARPFFSAAFGLAEVSEGRPIEAGTRFNLGSADKSFTALLIAQMIEAGQLQLSSRVSDLLPDFEIPGASEMTIRNLLTHSAGLGDPPGGIHAYSHDPYDKVSDLLPAIAAIPVAFAPGEHTSYSNEGYVVLGAIIERVTQKPFWTVLQERIYEPAGMQSSGHFVRDEVLRQCAMGYYHDRSDLFRCLPAKSNADILPWRGNSCGGGYSTAADIAAYFRALGNGQLVKPETLEMLTEKAGEIYPGVGYGMGFIREAVGDKVFVGHSGGGNSIGIGSSLRMSLDNNWSVAILGNCDLPYSDAILRDILPMLASADAL